jgi:putative Mg2+ transporter-C (MgtC) family protein
MPPDLLSWSSILLRLAAAFVVGLVLGIDRTARGRPAGMRTTMLTCLAGAVAMLLAEAVAENAGHIPGNSRLDPQRTAQGLLAGMGFIGAGAIIRRDNAVVGLTTAATLWFATIVGLCLGAGEWRLGGAGAAAGIVILWPLYLLEERVPREHVAALSVTAPIDAVNEADVHELIARDACTASGWAIDLDRVTGKRTVSCQVAWSAPPSDHDAPRFVGELSADTRVTVLKWEPAAS